jgi:quercetin dioxygenase-like cupin family protein
MDHSAFAALSDDQRYTQALLPRDTAGSGIGINLIRTPVGGGSPEGLHVHDYEQIFYVVRGTMHVEVDGAVFEAPAGSLVRFPEGVPHRNWATDAETYHLAINAPADDAARLAL